MTNTHIIINGKIIEYVFGETIKKEIDIVGNFFHEKLFEKSKSLSMEFNIYGELLFEFKEYFFQIMNIRGKSVSELIMSFLLRFFFYLPIYCIIIIFVIILFIITSLIMWILTLIFAIILKVLLDKLYKIKKYFDKIAKGSIKLKDNYKKLVVNLDKAKNNDWNDGLLLKIKKGLGEIGKLSNSCILDSQKLKKAIKNSKYNDIYDFKLYDSWIKNKLYKPILELENLLVNNKNSLLEAKINIELKLNSIQEKEYKEVLSLQLNRIELTLKNIDKNIDNLGKYMEKLM